MTLSSYLATRPELSDAAPGDNASGLIRGIMFAVLPSLLLWAALIGLAVKLFR